MKKVWLIVTTASLVLFVPAALADAPLKSTNYQITESVLGGGGLTNESSLNYSAGESIGDIGIGSSSSTNYQSNSGYTTTKDPTLSFSVGSSIVSGNCSGSPVLNFGTLTNAATNTATAVICAIDYTSYGYNIYAYGATPSNGSTTLASIPTAAPSSVGTEQYGMNLRANTSPVTFGANPSGGFGTYATGYGTVNNYQYNSGDIIATSAKSSGQTNFTASFIANASATTASGSYTGSLSLICVGSY